MTTNYEIFKFTIAEGASLSQAIRVQGYVPVQIIMPASWTAANLTFQNNEQNLTDDEGSEIVVTAAANKTIRLDYTDWLGTLLLRIRSGTSSVPVNQEAARDIYVVCTPATDVTLVTYTMSSAEPLEIEVAQGPGTASDDPQYVEAGDNGVVTTPVMPAASGCTLLSPTGGSKTVTAAGTAEPLAASQTLATWLHVCAKAANTNNVYLGDSGVDKDSSKQRTLDAGESVTIQCPAGYALDLNEFYIDVDTNGEGVDLLYLTA